MISRTPQRSYTSCAALSVMLLLTTTLVAGCGLNSSTSNSSSKATPPAKVRLNVDDMGMSNDTAKLNKTLIEIFQQRRKNYAYKSGMETRTDLPLDERLETTVFVRPDRAVKLGEVVKVIAAVGDTNASPILFPIPGDPSGQPVTHDRTKTSPAFVPGTDNPNPLLLVVSMQGDAAPAPSEQIIDGIPVVLSGKMRGPEGSNANDTSLVVVTAPKDGEYSLDEKRLEKPMLETAIRSRFQGKPQNERALFVKAGPDVSYGTLADIVFAAKLAGSELIYLITSEQEAAWKEQGLSFTLPSGWSRIELETPMPDTMNWKGQQGARLLIDVLSGRETSSPDSELQTEYERRLYQQKQGKFDEVRYLTLDGVKGLLRRSTDKERVSLHWDTFRKHEGKFQYLNVYLSVPTYSFKQRESELYGILYSIHFAQS
jgi:biopolymer transport protein ExbD